MVLSPSIANELICYAGPWGVVQDISVVVGDLSIIEALKKGKIEEGLDTLHVEEDHGSLRLNIPGESVAVPGRVIGKTVGGNTWNTFQAICAILKAHDPRKLSQVELVGVNSPWMRSLQMHPENRNLPIGLQEVIGGTRERVNWVFYPQGGGEPLYWTVNPLPDETGQLPYAKQLFLSSGGPDIFDEIKFWNEINPAGQLFYAPGSRVIKKGIPLEVLRMIHFLSCNLREARTLTGLTDADSETAARWFAERGVSEVRISDGDRGVFALTNYQDPLRIPGVSRRESHVVTWCQYLHEAGIPILDEANVNGCGDTRLGVELAALLLGHPKEEALAASNRVGMLNTFHPGSNIATFPPALLRELVPASSHYVYA